jgi:hypothetical protein
MAGAQPIRQRQYIMNPNYALKVKEDLDKLLDARFIYPIKTTPCLSPLVIVSKKMVNYVYVHGLSKVKCINKNQPISITFLGFNIGFSSWT